MIGTPVPVKCTCDYWRDGGPDADCPIHGMCASYGHVGHCDGCPEDVALRARIDAAVRGALWNTSNYPERVQVRMLGQDTGPLATKVVDAVMAVLSEHPA